jgi:hypothetical protein
MNPVARTLIAAGILLVVAGLYWQLGPKGLPIGRLPGDLVIQRGNLRIHLPIASCLLLSGLLSLVLYLIRRIGR